MGRLEGARLGDVEVGDEVGVCVVGETEGSDEGLAVVGATVVGESVVGAVGEGGFARVGLLVVLGASVVGDFDVGEVGDDEGEAVDGDRLGADFEGDAVGRREGEREGNFVGRRVGDLEGADKEGEKVGLDVDGDAEGLWVGPPVVGLRVVGGVG